MTIDEELALRLIKQRLPLRQQRTTALANMRKAKSEFTKVCQEIRKLDDEIDTHLI